MHYAGALYRFQKSIHQLNYPCCMKTTPPTNVYDLQTLACNGLCRQTSRDRTVQLNILQGSPVLWNMTDILVQLVSLLCSRVTCRQHVVHTQWITLCCMDSSHFSLISVKVPIGGSVIKRGVDLGSFPINIYPWNDHLRIAGPRLNWRDLYGSSSSLR